MKFLNILAILMASLSIAWAETMEEISPPEDHVVQLKFTIREEKMPAIINYLLNNSLASHNITTADIIELSKLGRYNLEETTQVFNYFNISAEEAFSVGSLETVLDSLNMEFGDFYRSMKDKLSVSDVTIQQVLQDLSIDQMGFLLALANQNYIYDILRDGNYSAEHVDAALATLAKTGDEVFVAVRGVLLEKILPLNSSEFMAILKDSGWSRQFAAHLWIALNITTRDVYEVEKFRDIFTAISDAVNENLTIAVFVDRNKLAVHEKAYNLFDSFVDGVTIKVEAGQIEVVPRETNRLGAHIVELTTTHARDKFIEITETYDFVENCTYVTIIDGKVSAADVTVEEESLTVAKTEGLVFNVGSPLACQGYLYGLAREQTDNAIIFDKFDGKGSIPEDGEDSSEVSGGSVIYSELMLSLAFNLIMCFVLL